MNANVEIAVVGAGVIGLATALNLAAAGREVVVVDPNEPGSGTSYGNAATIAPYACTPVGHPGILMSLPELLFSADSALAIRWQALPALAPWLARFVRECGAKRTEANSAAIAALLKDAVSAWSDLATQANASSLLCSRGCLYAYQQPNPDVLAGWPARLRARHGVKSDVLNPKDVAALEPHLPPMAGGGLFFPDAVHIDDPPTMTKVLAMAIQAQKGQILRQKVERIFALADGKMKLDGPGLSLIANKVVIAAGAWAKPLAKQIGDKIPLETERGYHLEFACDMPLLTRPVSPIEFGFYLTPLRGRLRTAGTVELGGLKAPPSQARLDFIEQRVRRLFPQLGAPVSAWLGFRPSLPDSLPVLGASAKHPSVIYAFGHGHIGMTLAAVTGRIVKQMIVDGNVPDVALACSPKRFAA